MTSQINDVSRAGTVNIRQADAFLVKLIRIVKDRRIIHCHFCAKPAIPQIRPVTHFAVANPHQIRESIAGQIGQIDGLRAIGKDQPRTSLLI